MPADLSPLPQMPSKNAETTPRLCLVFLPPCLRFHTMPTAQGNYTFAAENRGVSVLAQCPKGKCLTTSMYE